MVNGLRLSLLFVLGLCLQAPAQAVEAVQTGPGLIKVSNANDDAQASAVVLPGIGSAKLWAQAATNGPESASARASRTISGGGVILGRLGGLGDPQIVRAAVQLNSTLSHQLIASLMQAGPAGCCSFEATLSLNISIEREDAELGFDGSKDFEIDVVDQRTGRVDADGQTVVQRDLQFAASGDGFMSPSFEQAYNNGSQMQFSFLLPQGGNFRVGLDFEISVKAQATQPYGYECGSIIFPQGLCVAYPASAAVIFDASHSLYWGGLELVNGAGQSLPFDFLPLDGFDISQSYTTPVPEPATASLLLAGLSALAWAHLRGRHRKKANDGVSRPDSPARRA